jgi:Protein of unknown function DUF45
VRATTRSRIPERWRCHGSRDAFADVVAAVGEPKLPVNGPLLRSYDSPDLVDYALVHQLAHLHHRDHGPEFWRLVERAMPDAPARP